MKCYTCSGKGHFGKPEETVDEITFVLGVKKELPKEVIICTVCKGKGTV